MVDVGIICSVGAIVLGIVLLILGINMERNFPND